MTSRGAILAATLLRAELLEAGKLYARLWAHQSGGFLGEQVED